MNLDSQFAVARAAIAKTIERVAAAGEINIERTVADAKAWLRHYPNPVWTRRSAGQFWRHAKERREKRNSQI